MALEEDLVAAAGVVLAAEEVVEADLVQGRGTGVGGDVAADADVRPLRPVHHDGGIPAQPGPVLAFDLLVAGECRFLVDRDGVDVVRGGDHRNTHALRPGPLEQAAHNVLGTFGALFLNQGIQGLQPLGGLFRITIRQLVCQPAEDMGGIFSCSHVQPHSSSLNGWINSFHYVKKLSCISRLSRAAGARQHQRRITAARQSQSGERAPQATRGQIRPIKPPGIGRI